MDERAKIDSQLGGVKSAKMNDVPAASYQEILSKSLELQRVADLLNNRIAELERS